VVDLTYRPNQAATFRTSVPARLDRLPWARFHTLIVLALGVSWILNGIEVQLFSQGSVVLQDEVVLGLSASQVGLLPTVYLGGAVLGAVIFARLTDTLGRRKLFFVTLLVFMLGNVLSAFAPSFELLLVCRVITGMGLGGEQVAIISAVDEMIPARHRGRANIALGATIWLGTMAGAGLGFVLFDPDVIAADLGWRLALLIGPALCVGVLFLRRGIPESPRWLMTHGRGDEAERVVDGIEARLERAGHVLPPVPEDQSITIRRNPEKVSLGRLLRVLLVRYPKRSLAAFAAITTQGFLYNAIFFTFALVLANFYGIGAAALSYYIFIFGAGNALGALLGPLFDTVGRRAMVLWSYAGAGIILAVTGVLFYADAVGAVALTLLWCATFFLASAGAGASYVVASEVFPVEVRAGALSFFYVVAQVLGATGPLIYAALIGEGTDREPMLYGYLIAAVLMVAGGVVTWMFGVDAERRSLEDVATPLSAADERQ
jgi:MFS family permease